MNLINRYRIIIAFVLPVLILLSIRTCRNGSFKYDAKKWAEPSFDNSNVISVTGIGKLAGEKLISLTWITVIYRWMISQSQKFIFPLIPF